jgi:hypothetical protein
VGAVPLRQDKVGAVPLPQEELGVVVILPTKHIRSDQ